MQDDIEVCCEGKIGAQTHCDDITTVVEYHLTPSLALMFSTMDYDKLAGLNENPVLNSKIFNFSGISDDNKTAVVEAYRKR